jgi:hypothetical protein
LSFIEFLQPERDGPESLGDVFLDGADGDAKLRRCNLVAQALEADEHECRASAGGKLIQGLQGHGRFLFGLQDSVRRQLVERMMGFFEFAVGAPAPHCVAAAAVQENIGRGLEDEAGKVRHLSALPTIMQSQEHFLNQVVDLVTIGSSPKERA